MPSVVAGHLGVKGTVVSGKGRERIKEYEEQPRGGLTTVTVLEGEGENKWLRERNSLLRGWGLDGQVRILVCENGACREEKILDLDEVKDALPKLSDGIRG